MKDIMELFANIMLEELKKEEFRKGILQPLLIWFIWHIIPYVLVIICINFFLTIAAMCLVLYFRK